MLSRWLTSWASNKTKRLSLEHSPPQGGIYPLTHFHLFSNSSMTLFASFQTILPMSEREHSFSLRKQKKNAFIAFSYRHSKRATIRASRQKASKHMNETTLTSILIIAVVL